MEEHLKALEGVVARLETLTGAKQDVSPSKVMMVMSVKMDDGIYSGSDEYPTLPGFFFTTRTLPEFFFDNFRVQGSI